MEEKLKEPIGKVVSSKTVITVNDEGTSEIEYLVTAELLL